MKQTVTIFTKKGCSSAFLRLRHNRKYIFVSTGRPATDPAVQMMASRVNTYLADLALAGRLKAIDNDTLTGKIRSLMGVEKVVRGAFLKAYEEFAQSRNKPRTVETYVRTSKLLHRFDPMIAQRDFFEIDAPYISKFRSWLEGRGNTINTVNIHLRNMRAVFNHARDTGLTDCYPFSKIKIKNEETEKRALPIREVRRIFNSMHGKWRDVWVLIFCLRGINAIDLYNLRPGDYKNGRITYVRSKTGKRYSVKVEPEAAYLMRKWRGTERLFSFCEGTSSYRNWYINACRQMKKDIGHTTYEARHSVATLASQVGVPLEVIAQMLGHSDTSRAVTMVYVDPDESKADKGMRWTLDFVKGKRKPEW